ncbi:MAG: hypothetical protein D5R97_07370 [Candidatus Syntrophonatronum acetioxidans]|uniref:peptidylprolyl isomerase n=1 Tax=Candidatus Syntrophonatronum acetioxidans TaxID=1795816 RepID=A0A424YCC7_9FIRM|nr:MAG: hypothetical protein D5R97_07370 [Candidatus Syntrophonatronum acetioxidans]
MKGAAKKILVLVMTVFLLVSLGGCQEEEVAAEVNGDIITRAQLEERMLIFNLLMPDYAQSLEDEYFRGYVEQNLLTSMIQGTLVEQELERLELEIDEEDFEATFQAEVEEIIREYFDTEESLYQKMEEVNLEEVVLRNLVREGYLTQFLYEHITKEVTEEEGRIFFEENKTLFSNPAQVKVSHILVEEQEEAKKIINRWEEGESFEELLGEFSLDQPGEFIIYEEDVNFDQDFTRAAFEVNSGEISPPVETQFGWHVIKLHDRQEAQVFTFEEVKEEALAFKKEEVFTLYFNDLYEKADITNNLESI